MNDTTKTSIEGKVAKIINRRQLVINRGSEHGVEQGMKFVVIDDFEEILDPDTQESLGAIQREKIRVRVVEVQKSLAIASTYETYVSPGLGSYVRAFTEPTTQVRKLHIPQDYSATPIEEVEGFVNIGDKVVQIHEN